MSILAKLAIKLNIALSIAYYTTISTDEKVFILGGWGPDKDQSTIAEYSSSGWSIKGSLLQKRDEHGSILFGNSVMILGGYSYSGDP